MNAALACMSAGEGVITVALAVAFLLLAFCHAYVPYNSSDD